MRDPDGHRTELLLPGIQIIDIDDEPVMCPVQPEGELEPVGAAGAAELGRGGDEFRRRAVEQAPDGSPMTAERYLAEKKKDAAG